MDRELDGMYFRVKRNKVFENVCFSDLTEAEMDEVLKNRPEEWLKGACKYLGKRIKQIGEELDISCAVTDEE